MLQASPQGGYRATPTFLYANELASLLSAILMTEPLFLQPIFKERIWGGTALRERFGYHIPSNRTGECWAISAHAHGTSVVSGGPFDGWGLVRLWEERRDLFGSVDGDRFPLLTKILDANADLSVQVHPDDDYAWVHEQRELGKTECWYIIDCAEGAELILGHHARSREELQKQMSSGNWSDLLRRVQIRPGDFFYVPSGTIHALCAGTLVLETQQSSDTTYRVYDYNRRDEAGNSRQLHLCQALEVTRVPHEVPHLRQQTTLKDGVEITTFLRGEKFTVHRWRLQGTASWDQDQSFLLASVIHGEGRLETATGTFPFQKGDHFILPATLGRFTLQGRGEWIVSHL